MLQIHVNVCNTVQLLAGFLLCNGGKLENKLKTSNEFSSYIACKNRNRSALVRELLSNNSLFVGQLYEDKYSPCAPVIRSFLQLTSKQ